MALATLAAFLFEIFGGIVSKSLALLSDAFHVGVDLVSVALALGTEYLVRGENKRTKARIRGWGGVISGALLFASLIPILTEAVRRLIAPEAVHSGEMIIFAVIGLIGNAVSLAVLHKSREKHITHQSLNAHIISDLAQSIGVVVAGIVIAATGWEMIDPISSFIIVVLLFRLSIKTFKRSWDSLK